MQTNERRLQCGGIAQLGEHLICIQKVAGSIPVASTKFPSLINKKEIYFEKLPLSAHFFGPIRTALLV